MTGILHQVYNILKAPDFDGLFYSFVTLTTRKFVTEIGELDLRVETLTRIDGTKDSFDKHRVDVFGSCTVEGVIRYFKATVNIDQHHSEFGTGDILFY